MASKLFYTILDREVDQFPNAIMSSWNREGQKSKEFNVRKYCGIKPLYRVNIRLKNHDRRCNAQEGWACNCEKALRQ